MRKILLSFLLLTSVLLSHAQNPADNTWRPGYYYDLSGNKVSGFVADYFHNISMFHPNDDYLSYKPEKKGNHVDKIYAKDIKALVVGLDSFVVSDDKMLKSTPFLLVLMDGKTKLYATEVSRGSTATNFGLIGFAAAAAANDIVDFDYKYYYGTDSNNVTKMSRKDFMDVMSRLMADKPAVVAKIQDKTYRYGDMQELLVYYRTGNEKK